MKTSRYIILISFILTIICSVSIIFVLKDFKLYDILMGLMTGAFISFMLEIPNYAKTKKDNYRLFFYSLYNLKSSLAIFNNILEKSIKSNSRMTEKFYESNMNMIFNNFAILKNLILIIIFVKKREIILLFSLMILTINSTFYLNVQFYMKFHSIQSKEII